MTENIETHAATFQGNVMALDETGILSSLHFGDLHVTAQREESYRDFVALIDHANAHIADTVNFAVLQGARGDIGPPFRSSHYFFTRTGLLVVQSTQDRTAKNVSSSLNGARCRRILVQR
jgi:hypothetical protein